MEKTKQDMQGFLSPMPKVIVGADVGGTANFMAVAWVTRTNYAPPCIGIARGKMHHTNVGIREHGEFSVNLPPEAMPPVTDHVGLVTGAKAEKSDLFEVFRGSSPRRR